MSQGLLDHTIVIMAGGEGTRIAPYTSLPKPLLPLPVDPALCVIMDSFRAFGASRFVIVVRHRAEEILESVRGARPRYDISFVDEQVPRGTCGGLSQIPRELLTDAFFVSNCDSLVDADFAAIASRHVAAGSAATVLAVEHEHSELYDSVVIDTRGDLLELSNRTIARYVNTGVYMLQRGVIESIQADGAVAMPQVLNELVRRKSRVGVELLPAGSRLDSGTWAEYERALAVLRQETCRFVRRAA